MGDGAVLTKPEGFQVDHLGLAVNDLNHGLTKIEELTGVKAMLHPPEPGGNRLGDVTGMYSSLKPFLWG